jgi:hypothetical protein
MQKEKRTFSLKKKFTATPEQKVGLPVKRANGINGGKPVGRYRLCRIATLTESPTFCSQRPRRRDIKGKALG